METYKLKNMSNTVTTSKLFRLKAKDFTRGLLMVIIGAFLGGLTDAIADWITTDTFAFDRKSLVFAIKAGIVAGVGYLTKNFFTPAEIVLQNAPVEMIEKVEAGEAKVTVTSMKK